MFYGHVMCFHLQQPERREIFIFSGLSLSRRSISEKLTRLKIAADNLIVFAGEFFIEEIEDPKVDHENWDPAWKWINKKIVISLNLTS